jgi:hypothetical protein
MSLTTSPHIYQVRPPKDKHGVHFISDVLPFGWLWYGESDAITNAIGYAKFTAAHETLSVVAMRVRDKDRSPVGINR